MSKYFRIIILLACLIGATFEVILQITFPSQIHKEVVPTTIPEEQPRVESDNNIYDFSTDNFGMNYPPNIDNFDQDYDYEPVAQAKGTVRIPILTYHHIAPLPSSASARDYYVSPDMLEQQLFYLKIKNYKTLTPNEFYDQLATGQNPAQKSVMLTFDDGNLDNYENAFPLLKKYGFVGVFYISANRLSISSSRLKEMADAGMIIDSHGRTHIDLTKETDTGVLYSEIVGSKSKLEGITGKTVNSFSYPGCAYNGQDLADVRSAGYLLAVSCGKSIDHKISGRLALSRMHIYNDMENFKKRLSGIFEYPSGYSN